MEDEIIAVEIPSEYADAGFLASVKTEDGKLDLRKTMKKLQGQESLLGKRALPTKDSGEAEQEELMKKLSANFADSDDIAQISDTVKNAKELQKVLKEAGIMPVQAKKIVAAYMKDKNEEMSEEDFERRCKEEGLTDEKLKFLESTLSKENLADIKGIKNESAVKELKLLSDVLSKYNVQEKGIGAGVSSVPHRQPKGFCPEYYQEMKEAQARGASRKEKDAIMSKYGFNHETDQWDI